MCIRDRSTTDENIFSGMPFYLYFTVCESRVIRTYYKAVDYTIYSLSIFYRVTVMVKVRFNVQIKYSNSIILKNFAVKSRLVCELSSPRLDWPRVGLSASYPVSLHTRAYSNGAVQPILCSPKSRMCSPISSCKIVQSKICALNFHTNQQQEFFSHLLHLQRWQVEAGNLFILQAGGLYRISQ